MKTVKLITILRSVGAFVVAKSLSYGFDYFVYPIVTYKFSFAVSLSILFGLALILNYLLIVIYDRFKKDFFGFEELKKQKDGTAVTKRKWLQKIMLLGDVPMFIVLSYIDPFFAALYKRKSTNYDGFEKRDLWMLVLATLIGCLIWSSFWTVLIYVKQYIFG